MTPQQIELLLIEKLNKIKCNTTSSSTPAITDFKETVRRVFSDYPDDTVDALFSISSKLNKTDKLRSLYEP